MKTIKNRPALVPALLLTLVLGVISTLIAQTAMTWDKIGTRTVDFTIDRDVVTASRQEAYTALKIKVTTGTINVHKVTVHFANGDSQDVKFPSEMNKSNDGQIVDLKGNKRMVEKITFWYDTVNKDKDKATVEIWARK